MTVRMGITTEQQRNNNKHGNIRNNKLVVTLLWFSLNKKGDFIEYMKRSEQLFESTLVTLTIMKYAKINKANFDDV